MVSQMYFQFFPQNHKMSLHLPRLFFPPAVSFLSKCLGPILIIEELFEEVPILQKKKKKKCRKIIKSATLGRKTLTNGSQFTKNKVEELQSVFFEEENPTIWEGF